MDPARPDEHPLDEDLVAYADGELAAGVRENVEAHVVACEACSALLGRLTDPVAGETDDRVTAQPYSIVVIEPKPITGEPDVGDLWQLDWERGALLALVLAVDARTIQVAPVSAEDPLDERAVAFDAGDLGATLFAWPSLRRSVPLGVFGYPVGEIAPEIATVIRDAQPAAARDWNGALQVADLMAVLDILSEASWAPQPAEEPLSLRELLQARGLLPAELSAATGIPASAITELLRRARTVSEEEANALGKALDVNPNLLRAPASIPAALVHAIERPVHRAALRLCALAQGISESAARMHAAEAVVAMPARTTNQERDVEAWDQLLRHHLDA
jgi:transcriptional regulator with XRE-family HTH domain